MQQHSEKSTGLLSTLQRHWGEIGRKKIMMYFFPLKSGYRLPCLPIIGVEKPWMWARAYGFKPWIFSKVQHFLNTPQLKFRTVALGSVIAGK